MNTMNEVPAAVTRATSPEGQRELLALAQEARDLIPVVEEFAARAYKARLIETSTPDAFYDTPGYDQLDKALCRLTAALGYALDGHSDYGRPSFAKAKRV